VACVGEDDEVTPDDVPEEVSELEPESEAVAALSEALEPVSEEFDEVDPVADELASLAERLPEVEELASEPEDFLADELELPVEELPDALDALWALVGLAASLVAEPVAGAIAWMNTARASVEAVTAPKIARRTRERRRSAEFLRCAPSRISSSRSLPEFRISGVIGMRLPHFIERSGRSL
jgi:hypothetical protein